MFNLTPWRKDKDGLRSEYPLTQLRNEFDQLFDRFFGRFPSVFNEPFGSQTGWGFDLDDTGKEIVVRAEAPGFEPQDFEIQVAGNTLSIHAERKQEGKEGKKDGSFYSERRLERTVTLPAAVNADRIDCRYKNGILELRLPRTEQAQAKRIQVKS